MDTFRETQQEFRFLLLRSEDLRPLWRPEPEIIFLLKGAGHIYFTDSKSEYTLRETDIFVINSFEIQHLELEGNALALSLAKGKRTAKCGIGRSGRRTRAQKSYKYGMGRVRYFWPAPFRERRDKSHVEL